MARRITSLLKEEWPVTMTWPMGRFESGRPSLSADEAIRVARALEKRIPGSKWKPRFTGAWSRHGGVFVCDGEMPIGALFHDPS